MVSDSVVVTTQLAMVSDSVGHECTLALDALIGAPIGLRLSSTSTVAAVSPGSAAERAGLRVGDRILAVQGETRGSQIARVL